MAKRTEEELERLREEITERILNRGIDEGHDLDLIINDKDEEE
jgi:hypothetical protein